MHRVNILLIARLLQNGLGFGLSLSILYKFGLASIGLLTMSSIAVVIMATVFTFGMPHVLARAALAPEQRNTLGLLAAVAGLCIALPVSFAVGVVFGRDAQETRIITLLCLAGPYFSMTAIADALLVLKKATRHTVLPPLGSWLGLVCAHLLTDDYASYAALLAAGRFAGVAAAYSRLHYARCETTALRAQCRQGLRYLVPDSIGIAAEQVATLVVASLASREQLGIFGLCRQLLTVSDTPLWSKLALWYPRLCEGPQAYPALAAQMLRLSLWIGIGLAIVSPLLGIWVYQAPAVAMTAPLMMLCVPFRYAGSTAELTLRAMGATAAVNGVMLLRCLLVALLPLGFWWGGIQGTAVAMIVQVAIAAFAARRMVSRKLGSIAFH